MKGAAPRRRPPEPNWPRRRQKVLLPIQTSKRHTGGPRPPRALILGDPVLLGLSFWGTLPSSGSHSVPFPDLALTTASGGSVPSGVFLFGSGLGISVSSLENNRQVWGGFRSSVRGVLCTSGLWLGRGWEPDRLHVSSGRAGMLPFSFRSSCAGGGRVSAGVG